jgi:hypothetical protein
VYAKGKSTEQLQEEALAWWVGLEPEQARQGKPKEWSNILRHTSLWNWPAVQGTIREKIERIFRPGKQQKEAERVTAERQLGWVTGADGERYWNYHTAEVTFETSEKWASAAVDRTLLDLQDLSVKVVGLCEECGRLFVRLRPTRSRYCSGSCRGRAYLEAHGFKPASERSGRERPHRDLGHGR